MVFWVAVAANKQLPQLKAKVAVLNDDVAGFG